MLSTVPATTAQESAGLSAKTPSGSKPHVLWPGGRSVFNEDLHLYRYVRNSSIYLKDPTGLTSRQCFRPLGGTGLALTMAAMIPIVPMLVQPPVPGVSFCAMHEYLVNTDLPPGHNTWGFDPKEIRPASGTDICWTIPDPLGPCVWSMAPQLNADAKKYNIFTTNCQQAIN